VPKPGAFADLADLQPLAIWDGVLARTADGDGLTLAVVELDLNPVIAQPAGCVVVDARVRVRRPERIVRAKTW